LLKVLNSSQNTNKEYVSALEKANNTLGYEFCVKADASITVSEVEDAGRFSKEVEGS
jgi:hypothetical protein